MNRRGQGMREGFTAETQRSRRRPQQRMLSAAKSRRVGKAGGNWPRRREEREAGREEVECGDEEAIGGAAHRLFGGGRWRAVPYHCDVQGIRGGLVLHHRSSHLLY